MRTLWRMAGATTTALLAAVAVAGAASASPAQQARPARPASAVSLRGGRTEVTTAPGIAGALLGAGIVPITTLPGTEGVVLGKSGPLVQLSFPVTGGRVSLNPLGGQVRHRGGILFVDASKGQQIIVSNFTINLARRVLTGIVNGNPHARVTLFRLGLAHATLHVHGHWVTARGITVRLTSTAAGALDATFHTTLLKGGMLIGTAGTTLHI